MTANLIKALVFIEYPVYFLFRIYIFYKYINMLWDTHFVFCQMRVMQRTNVVVSPSLSARFWEIWRLIPLTMVLERLLWGLWKQMAPPRKKKLGIVVRKRKSLCPEGHAFVNDKSNSIPYQLVCYDFQAYTVSY